MENICKDKSKLNLSIDIIMFLLLLPIAGIGFLIKYVLIPGIQRNSIYGNNTDLEFLGMSRHQWGTVHLTLSIIFLVLLIIHIVLHWKMITCVFQRLIPYKSIRSAFTFLLTVLGFLLISFPLLVKPDVIERQALHQNRKMNNNYTPSPNTLNIDKPIQPTSKVKHKKVLTEEYEVRGSMTLQYVAEKYDVPVNIIAADLKIPENLAGKRLGRLRKLYHFTMDDVRNSIYTYKKTNK
jgi:LysM repeat protein